MVGNGHCGIAAETVFGMTEGGRKQQQRKWQPPAGLPRPLPHGEGPASTLARRSGYQVPRRGGGRGRATGKHSRMVGPRGAPVSSQEEI